MHEDWPGLVNGSDHAQAEHHRQPVAQSLEADVKWIDGNVGEARDALLKMWSEDDRTPGDRVRAFDDSLPAERVLRGELTGTRLNVASYFMMGIDPQAVSAVPAETRSE